MFNFLKKKQPEGDVAKFKISGMHCTSCSMSIDGELEDNDGVVQAVTSYKRSTTTVVYDKEKISAAKIGDIIVGLDYDVELEVQD